MCAPKIKNTPGERSDMRPIKWGLAAVLCAAVLAPAAVISAPKAAAPASEAQRKQGMAEAPPLVQAAGVNCQVSDARFVGTASDPQTKTEPNFSEVGWGQRMGSVVQAPQGGAPSVFSCGQLAPARGQPVREAALNCVLP